MTTRATSPTRSIVVEPELSDALAACWRSSSRTGKRDLFEQLAGDGCHILRGWYYAVDDDDVRRPNRSAMKKLFRRLRRRRSDANHPGVLGRVAELVAGAVLDPDAHGLDLLCE